MGTGKDILKWMGSKTLDGVKAGGNAIGKEISKSVEEQKRKNAVYKEEFKKAEQEERIKLKIDKDDVLRRKAREDARRKVRGGEKKVNG